MEDGRPDPRVHARERECEVVRLHGVPVRDAMTDLLPALKVGEEVEDGEENGCRLLHSRESPKRPLAVVLLDGGVVLDSDIGDHVHAAVLAVINAGPARELQSECEGQGRVGTT